MFCIQCEGNVQPSIDIGENGKPLAVCPKGHGALGTALAATDQPEPVDHTRDDLPPAGSPELSGETIARHIESDIIRRRRVEAAKPATTFTSNTDIVGSARLRLQTLDAELERLAGLQRERRQLAAMIAAADAADEPEPAAQAAE